MDRPSTRDRKRPQSARARLTPAPPPGPAPQFTSLKSEKIAKEAKERVKSAKAIKNKHTSSAGVFSERPPSRSAPSGFKRFTSMYSKDFDGTFVPPAEIRPTSPTRRNNPHPAKVERVRKRETLRAEEWMEIRGVGLIKNILVFTLSSNSWFGGCRPGKLELFPTRKG